MYSTITSSFSTIVLQCFDAVVPDGGHIDRECSQERFPDEGDIISPQKALKR